MIFQPRLQLYLRAVLVVATTPATTANQIPTAFQKNLRGWLRKEGKCKILSWTITG